MDEVLVSLRRCGDPETTTVPPAVKGLEPTDRLSLSASASRRSQTRRAATRSKGILLGAAVGALAVVGMIGYAATRRGPAAPAPPSSQTAAARIVASPLPAVTGAMTAVAIAPVASAPPPVKLRVSTDPDGASVKEDGVEVCSSTPCDILYEGDDAEPGSVHKLTVSRQGYRPEVRSVKVGDGPVSAKLTPLPRAIPVPAPKAPDMPAVPTGYKTDIPY